MRTSYREISKKEFEVSVLDNEDKTTVLGILIINQHGKWQCRESYFPVGSYAEDTINDKDSMVQCGRALVSIWERYEAQQKFNEKLKKRKLIEQKEETDRQKELDDSYFESLWDLDDENPFGGGP
tara:strand:+ start:526 stop:900 length:375 start_codon:yes stop_codon:yes gene_type:complete